MNHLTSSHPQIPLPLNSSDEVRIKIGLRNNRMISLREKLGLTQGQVAKKTKIPLQYVNGFECLRDNPIQTIKPRRMKKDGTMAEGPPMPIVIYTKKAKKLAAFYGVECEFLFPESLKEIRNRDLVFSSPVTKIPKYLKAEITSSEALPSAQEVAEQNNLADSMTYVLKSLTPREELVLKKRFFEDKTLEESGKEIGVTGSRCREIEAKALRKLRCPERSRFLKPFAQEY